MAELLAVAAAGNTVAQAVKSLSELAVSLDKLWEEVEGAPDTMQDLMVKLRIAGKLVSSIKTKMETAEPSDSSSLPSLQSFAIEYCGLTHHLMKGIVEDLRADIASSRKRKKHVAGVKVVNAKKRIEAYERRLQRMLRYLELVAKLHTA